MNVIKRLFLAITKRYYRLLPELNSYIKAIQAEDQLLIVTQGRSWLVEALLNSISEQAKLGPTVYGSPETEAPIDTTKLWWVSIHDKKALNFVLTKLPDISYSTLNIFRGKGPIRNRPSYRTSWLDYVALLFAPIVQSRFLVIFFGDPARISEHALSRVPKPETPSVHRLIRHFKLDFYRNLKMVRGTPFQSFAVQRRVVLSGPEYDREVKSLATRAGVSPRRIHYRAKALFNRMAARPFAPFYVPAAIVVEFILNRLFSDITVRGLDRFAATVKRDTVVLVPMHRSHLDYLLLGSILYEANVNTAVVAAGVNLSFWPFGSIIRSLGGYFVKRNARGDRIHALVLRRYVTYLIKRGHLQEFFIEGGRSRSGRMRPPRLGLLNIMVSAYRRGERRDLLFVPVSISYEHVIEDSEYGKENTGRSKTKENLTSLFRARSIFKHNYKEVIVQFGQPLSLARFTEQYNREKELLLPKSSNRRSSVVHKLGDTLTRQLELQSSVGLRNLSCTALLMAPDYGLPRTELDQQIHALAKLARLLHKLHPDHEGGEYTQSLQWYLDRDDEYRRETRIAGVVATHPVLGEELVYVPGSVRFTADFYKNSTIHIFFPIGILSLLELMEQEISVDTALRFYDIFADDYLLGERNQFSSELNRTVEILVEAKVLTHENQVLRFSDRNSGYFLPALLQAPIQTLLWIHYHLARDPDSTHPNEKKPKRALHYSTFLQELQSGFTAMKYSGVLNRTEACSLVALTSTLESLKAREVIQFVEQGGRRAEIRVLQDCPAEVNFLEQANNAIVHWQNSLKLEGARASQTYRKQEDDVRSA